MVSLANLFLKSWSNSDLYFLSFFVSTFLEAMETFIHIEYTHIFPISVYCLGGCSVAVHDPEVTVAHPSRHHSFDS